MRVLLALTLATGVLMGPAAVAASADPDPASTAAATVSDVLAATGSADLAPASKADSDSAAVVTSSLGTVDVPRDPGRGVSIGTPEGHVGIDLPGGGAEAQTSNGTTVYTDTQPGVDTAVQPTADGGVRVLVSISAPSAPKDYSFPLTLPEGASASMDGSGSVVLTAADGNSLGGFTPAWAKDANGAALPTSYSLQNNVLVQHVAFTADSSFPVVADPWYNPFSWNWHKVGRVSVDRLKRCGVGALGGTVGLGVGSVVTNVLRNRAGLAMISVGGGPYGYVGVAVAGCVVNQF